MVDLADVFSHLHAFKVLVLGDFLLDAYTSGKVKRISPEAPVPVLEVFNEEDRAGGAGNVVLNLLALGGAVWAVGRIGADPAGKKLRDQLKGANMEALLIEPGYQTPVKTRVIADGQQLLRIDRETIQQVGEEIEKVFIDKLSDIIPHMQIIAISDYGKGLLTEKILQHTIRLAKEHNIPCVVDPKGINFSKYRGVSLIKPNFSEAVAASGSIPHTDLNEIAKKLSVFSDALLITRSESGISVFEKDQRFDFPVRFRALKDVTGAGDTVLATICLAIANGLSLQVAAQLANIAAGIAIERIGCVQITLEELAARLLEYADNTKILDEKHIFAWQKALQNKEYSLLSLSKEQEMTGSLFRVIQDLSVREPELILYMQDGKESDSLVQVLASLEGVKSIILEKAGLRRLCMGLKPCQVYAFENNRLVQARTLLDSLLLQADAITAPPKQTSPL
jgi:rfaE bifunctional protein kinase chain/domain